MASRVFAPTLAAILGAAPCIPAWAQKDEALEFFREEAAVVTASLKPKSIEQAPATVYVVTSDEIKASGAQTIWDALRTVPGVDVMTTRAFQGEVSIRGLNRPFNNRTLILLDGKTVLDPFFDFVTWETIPVTLDEIARIEVVEGPASSLYGANAINGVINIITKAPEQLKGGQVSYSGGEYDTHFGTALYGDRRGKFDYKMGLGWRSGRSFQNEDMQASSSKKFHGLVGYDFSQDSRLSVSGGLSELDTQTTTGPSGTAFEEGGVGFVRTDYRYKDTKLRAFWNHGRTSLDDFTALQQPQVDYDMYDANLQHSTTLPFHNNLTVGGSYRENDARSKVFGSGLITQDLWSLFFEDEWEPRRRWTVTVDGRVDHHPLAPTNFSPRGSVLFAPADGQVLRFSAGTSFRNPTLAENFLNFSESFPNPPPGGMIPNPPFTSINTETFGNRALGPERMFQLEAAHDGKFGPVKTNLSIFYYRLRGIIQATNPVPSGIPIPPTFPLQTSFVNQGGARALGYQAGLEAPFNAWLRAFANYSYQYIKDDDASTLGAEGAAAPKHKVNGGLRVERSGLTAGFTADWVDKTLWSLNPQGAPIVYQEVPDYLLLNAYAGYAFSGRWRGWEAGVSAFNLANHRHFEALPASSAAQPGQNAEVIHSRYMANVAYHF